MTPRSGDDATAETFCVDLFMAFLDALYPAVLGEGSWGRALKALLALGAGGGSQRRTLFEAAMRHVQHALAISRRLGGEAQHTAVLECTTGALPCGLLLLDARASVLFASERAHALLRGRNGAQLEDGRLRSLRGLEDRGLARGLARLLSGPQEDGGALCVDLPAQGLHARLRLLLMRAAAEPGGPAAVLALAFEQGSPSLPGNELLRDIYGFSVAEAELAGLLLSGQSLGEAARSRSVTLNTAKSQLRNVLRKTGSRNQADLMRTLAAGPAGLLQGLGGLAGGAVS